MVHKRAQREGGKFYNHCQTAQDMEDQEVNIEMDDDTNIGPTPTKRYRDEKHEFKLDGTKTVPALYSGMKFAWFIVNLSSGAPL